MELPPCANCMFCEELESQGVMCSNADLAQEAGWEEDYLVQGYLVVPLENTRRCFWHVKKPN